VKALVLAGGSGTRLRPFSYSMPKQLIPIANRPVLWHVLDNLRAIGVTEVAMIVGGQSDDIRNTIGDGSPAGVQVTYVRQDRPLGLAHCVELARPLLGDDDFVMYLGDTMLPDGIADAAQQFQARRPAAHLLLYKVADPTAFGVAELGPGGAVRRLVEKPRRPRSNLAIVGVYFFTGAVHEAVAAIEPSARGELEITDAIQWLVEHGAGVTASEYHGYWKDTGRVEDVLACNAHVLAGQQRRIDGEVDGASELVGAVTVEAGARVARSRIEGPAIVGTGTVVQDSQVGPNCSIGRDCVLREASVAESILLDGSSIAGVRGVYGSLIGRAASIGAAGRHRLVVGDHTHIEMAA
jgi:glucose-1-phosphate thymidylyltransferase